MAREIVATQQPGIDRLACPLWYCLDESSRYALETAYRRATDYKRKLTPPERHPDLIETDCSREMQQRPGQGERHMRET